MLTKIQIAARSRAGVRRWYGENRESYNELRRQRYATNKETRDKARVRASQRRQDERDGVVVIERKLTREVNGKMVKVYSTGQIAESMDRTPQMLRNWERGGLIPASIFSDTHRLYTKAQASMITNLGRVIKRNGGAWEGEKVQEYIKKIKQRW